MPAPHAGYQGCTTGASSAPSRSTIPARRIASSGPPPRAAASCASTTTASTTSATALAAARNGQVAPGSTSATAPRAASASSVAGEYQVTASSGTESVASQPRPTPAASVSTVNVAIAVAAAAVVAPASGRRPDRCRAHASTTNGSARPALTFTATAAVSRTVPATGRRPSTSAAAAATMPMINSSWCTPPTRCTIVSGFASTAHPACGSEPPRCRVSRGSAHHNSPIPTSSTRRTSSTPAATFSPVTATTPLLSSSASGPYGDGVGRHSGCTLSSSGPSSAAGPTV